LALARGTVSKVVVRTCPGAEMGHGVQKPKATRLAFEVVVAGLAAVSTVLARAVGNSEGGVVHIACVAGCAGGAAQAPVDAGRTYGC